KALLGCPQTETALSIIPFLAASMTQYTGCVSRLTPLHWHTLITGYRRGRHGNQGMVAAGKPAPAHRRGRRGGLPCLRAAWLAGAVAAGAQGSGVGAVRTARSRGGAGGFHLQSTRPGDHRRRFRDP